MFVMTFRSQSDFELASNLIEAGLGDTQIARQTGIPRATISAWRHGRGSRYHRRLAVARSSWRPDEPREYSYLLGVYLGDGSINVHRHGSATLVISLDARYPAIIAEIERALGVVMPGPAVTRSSPGEGNLAVVRLNHPALPYAFPQHGPGHKHEREIALTDWQRRVTHDYPEELLRGLIHSDGCRTVNRFTTILPSGRAATYEYPRYFFSNLSEGIRDIFCEHCDLLGVRWTRSNPRNISVSHRNSVALLDEFVGPKR